MKEHFQDHGVRKWAGNDLIELQSEPLAALQTLVEPYAPCILQGCRVKENGDGTITVEPGLVALQGKDAEGNVYVKIARFAGVANEKPPVYLTLQCETESRVYGDSNSKAIAYNYKAVATAQEPEAPYLEIKASGNKHLVDTLGITEKLKQDGGDASKTIVSFTKDTAEERGNVKSGSTLGTLFGKIERWFGDLKALAFKEQVAEEDLIETLKKKVNEQADWTASTGVAYIKNKPVNATTVADGFMSKEDKAKLENIADGANKTIVDSELKSDSKNPVENQVVKAELDKKLPLSGGTISGNLEVTGQLKEDGQRVYSPNNRPTASAIGAAASGHTHSYLPLSGGTMTGPITYNTASGTSKTSNYISAGGGYGTGSGKYGLKLLAVDQSDCQGGIGADLTGGSYELTVATGKNPNNANTERITFAKHVVNSKTYTKLAEIDGSGNFNAIGQVKENGIRVYSPNHVPTAAAVGALPSTGGTISGNLNVTGQVKENGQRVYSPNNIPTPAEIGVAAIILGNGMPSSTSDSMCRIPKSGILGNKSPKFGDIMINVSFGLMTIGEIVRMDFSAVYIKLDEALQLNIN